MKIDGAFDKSGLQIEQPIQEWCLECGLGKEAYPALDDDAIVKKYTSKPAFKAEFRSIAQVLAKQVIRLAAPKEVSSGSGLTVDVYIEVAFVPLTVFDTKWTLPPTHKRKQITLTTPNGQETAGILISKQQLPAKLPHFIVRLSATQWCQIKHMKLCPEQVVRKKQAKERYEKEVADTL